MDAVFFTTSQMILSIKTVQGATKMGESPAAEAKGQGCEGGGGVLVKMQMSRPCLGSAHSEPLGCGPGISI